MTRSRTSLAPLLAALVLVVALCGTTMAGYAAGKASGNHLIKKHSLSGNRLKADSVTGKEVQESTLATVPHANLADQLPPSALRSLTPIAPWLAGMDRPLGFRKDASGIVHLQGAVFLPSPGTAHMLDLPPGARPGGTAFFAVSCDTQGHTPGIVTIGADGSVELRHGISDYVALDSISYYAEG